MYRFNPAMLLTLVVAAAICCKPATAACGGTCDFPPNPSIPNAKCNGQGVHQDPDFGSCAPKIRSDCQDPANNQCRVCSLYIVAHDTLCADTSSKAGGHKVDTEYCITSSAPANSPVKGSQTTIQIATADAKSKTRHWKIVPKFAITGNEGSVGGLDQLWADGVNALKALPFGTSTTSMNPDDTGFVNNSPCVRTAHQLHIHIGALDSNFKKQYLNSKPQGFQSGQWSILNNDEKKKIIMKCSSKTDAFTEYKSAPSNVWPATYTLSTGAKLEAKYHTTVMLVKGPGWCPVSNCFCTLLLRDTGDANLLHY